MDGMSLLDVLRGVMLDPAEQAAYNANPGAYLERYGYEGVDAADLSEAFGLVADTLTPEQAQAWEASTAADDIFGADTADFDSEPGVADAGLPSTDPALDQPETTGPDAGIDAPAEPALSFGEGGDAGASDLDDLSFEEAVAPGLDDLAGTGHDDIDDGIDSALAGTGDDLGAGLDHDGTGDGIDDLDDIAELDALGGLDDGGAGDVDIGSF
jgi:hypothetical protein